MFEWRLQDRVLHGSTGCTHVFSTCPRLDRMSLSSSHQRVLLVRSAWEGGGSGFGHKAHAMWVQFQCMDRLKSCG